MNLKSIIKQSLITITITLLPTLLNAADVTIEMLNKLGKESMVYSQKIVKINLMNKTSPWLIFFKNSF